MTNEELAEKISKTAVKRIVRKYPFILYGEFSGIFTAKSTYLKKASYNDTSTGIRTILWVDPNLFFSQFSTNTFLYDSISKNKQRSTVLNLAILYEKNTDERSEAEKVSEDILRMFYEVGKYLDSEDQLGFKDFFIRYAFYGSQIGDWDGFTDWDFTIPPSGY
jgi:hypothetical protein